MKPAININVNFHESNNIMRVMVTCRTGTVHGGPFDGSVTGALRPHPSLYKDVCGSPFCFPVLNRLCWRVIWVPSSNHDQVHCKFLAMPSALTMTSHYLIKLRIIIIIINYQVWIYRKILCMEIDHIKISCNRWQVIGNGFWFYNIT